jgi:anti-sigma B factor antagonist
MTGFESPVPAGTGEPSEEPSVSTAVEWHGRAVVLAVSGEIDMVTAPRFEEALTSVLRERPEVVVVDLAQVSFFASAGLTALVAAYRQADERTEIGVVATGTATARPLQVTALDRKIPVFASREEALAGN